MNSQHSIFDATPYNLVHLMLRNIQYLFILFWR